ATYSGKFTFDIGGGGIAIRDRTEYPHAGKFITLNLTDSTIRGNEAPHGGGLYLIGGTTTLTGSTVSDNNATGVGQPENYSGGGLYIAGGTLTLHNSKVRHNTATNGAGLRASKSTIQIEESTFNANEGDALGGGIDASHGELTVSNSA